MPNCSKSFRITSPRVSQHIVTGPEHIAFIVALILWGRRVWPLVGVVTAFTLAHSVTLSLAVLEVVTLPARLVETFVALSIVYVAAENFWVRDLRRRWWLAALFGLVHGFGFASLLRRLRPAAGRAAARAGRLQRGRRGGADRRGARCHVRVRSLAGGQDPDARRINASCWRCPA